MSRPQPFWIPDIFLLAGLAGAGHRAENYLYILIISPREYRYVTIRAHAIVSIKAGRNYFRHVPAKNRMSENFFQRKLLRPVVELLKQGVTPEKLALSLALGVALGIFPAIGSTTALCAMAAFALHLNLPAIQIVNYFMYPAQIALLIPFFRFGEKLFRTPRQDISVPQIYALLHASVWNAIRLLWTTTWHAMVVWCLIAPVLAALVYVILLPALRISLRRMRSGETNSRAKAA